MTVRIVVPCFDEADRLDLGAFAELVEAVDQLVFVDDGSHDSTFATIQAFAATWGDKVDLIGLPVNVGKGEAVRLGLQAAIGRGSTLVGYLDADLATPPAEMLRLVRIATDQPDRLAVIGSRVALLGHTVVRRASRHYLGRLYATAASLALDVPVYDTQCGAKVFRVGAPLRSALSEPFRDRWSFDVELLGRLLSHVDPAAAAIVEVPLREWRDVAGTSVGLLDGGRAVFALVGLRRRLRAHRRRQGCQQG